MPPWIIEIIIAVVSALAVVLAAAIPAYITLRSKLMVIGRDAAEAKDQVANTHESNLRDDLDEKFGALAQDLGEMRRDVSGIRADHQATRRELGQLHGEDRAARREAQQMREEARDLRQRFLAHTEETAPMMPMLRDLHHRYATEE
ncbi:DUF2746 domain-containing protein [Citricoccus sp.]|uniref:DUF2746 domain-containing protein n=1 Tax=Citricoccus sp. TaxID=1978372 RepID=UPI0028BE6B26|nr:DUF2746 domain-containing protein [Citricoccus sp.]